jgi:hypothetical protein|tara:strand:+ start:232 stop:465 length:234 start_codon:yes stop_codon:yes gene_type:complete
LKNENSKKGKEKKRVARRLKRNSFFCNHRLLNERLQHWRAATLDDDAEEDEEKGKEEEEEEEEFFFVFARGSIQRKG